MLTNLMSLLLSGNNLTGEIPPELGEMPKLTTLWLSHNRLTGEIPPELVSLPNLEYLTLRSNLLTGCVPSALHLLEQNDLDRLALPDCPEPPEPPDTGTGLAPTPHSALPAAVNVFATVATVVAILGIVAGLRTRSRS